MRKKAPTKFILAAATALLLAGCATIKPNNNALLATPDKSPAFAVKPIASPLAHYAQTATREPENGAIAANSDAEVRDPYEKLNRRFNQFNTGFDRALVRPASKVYGVIVPPPIRLAIKNSLRHLEIPGDLVNYALQGNGKQAGHTLKRFFINSTLGIGGILDVAEYTGTPYNPTDFGLTLDDWGVGEGDYYVLPVLGPSTTRDGFGRLVDTALQPQTYLGFIFEFAYGGLISRGVETIDKRHRNGDLLDNVIFASPDPYVTLRSTYIQRRRALASDNIIGAEGLRDSLPTIATAR